MTSLTLLASLPAIIALVNFLKAFGVTGKWALLAAVVLGAGLSVSDLVFAGNPIYQAAAGGVLLGLAAAGIYDLTKPAAKNVVNVTVPKTPASKK